ncbi:MAG TPA: HepT-like ribonuclease domain-containing protein [Ktedonobacterales bacterium]|nr:HepT-like ribonuclease domain-containing protein [Ktedonobacterales bacterium]
MPSPVARRLEILGEAARQLPAEWKAQHTGAPWRVIAEMRNRLIHGYFSVDVGIVWRTVTQDLAPVEQELRRILAHEYPNPQP